jgi:hypothetical protein
MLIAEAMGWGQNQQKLGAAENRTRIAKILHSIEPKNQSKRKP